MINHRWLGIIAVSLAIGCQTPDRLGRLPALAVPRSPTPPVIDGNLGDECWQRAAVIPSLLPAYQHTVPPQPTTVRVLWDAKNLYFSFDCVDADVFCTGTKRHDDALYEEDVCEVFIDGFGDGRQFIEIQVNPAGVNLDLMYLFTKAAEYTPEMRFTPQLCDTDRWKFLEWDLPGLRTAARRTATGWSAELAIPAPPIMKRLGRTDFFSTTIRANFVRYDWAGKELQQQSWSTVLLGNPHNSPARMGHLHLKD
ncbi:MAG: hypothetical protein PCFJNLEI_01335 [Verrucomicrobiae bacterium]|nr:hypothetical protein [Verrucomicrobiae bacterium]